MDGAGIGTEVEAVLTRFKRSHGREAARRDQHDREADQREFPQPHAAAGRRWARCGQGCWTGTVKAALKSVPGIGAVTTSNQEVPLAGRLVQTFFANGTATV